MVLKTLEYVILGQPLKHAGMETGVLERFIPCSFEGKADL